MNKLIIILISLIICSCGLEQKEVDRIEIEKLSTIEETNVFESSTIYMEKNEKLFFWSKLDMEYDGDLKLTCQVQVFNDKDENIMLLEMNPLDVDTRIMCFEKSINSKTNYSCTGRIQYLQFEDKGEYHFKVIMFANSSVELDMKEAVMILKKK